MKKKLIFLLIAIASATILRAQQGEIIYTDYGPEGWSYEFVARAADFDTLQVDLDNDGIVDFYYHGSSSALMHAPVVAWVRVLSKYGDNYYDTFRWCSSRFHNGESHFGVIGDTIPNALSWGRGYVFDMGYYENNIERPNARFLAFRFPQEDGGYCYGWLEQSIEWIKYYEPGGGTWNYNHNTFITLYRWAYCTVPDYPLRIGQTSFEWDAVDHTAESFASIQPNPTTGMVTVRGKNLRQIEVYDALGQRIASLQACDGDTTIDLGGQPAGIYFVNLTYQDGKRSVKKVVKQ